MVTDTLTRDDHGLLTAIVNESDFHKRCALVVNYWQDLDRADRTPREIMYFHIGMLAGMVDRLLYEQEGIHNGVRH